MNHDGATRIESLRARLTNVLPIWVGNVNREEELAVRIAYVEQVGSFRRAKVALKLLVPGRTNAERDVESSKRFTIFYEVQLSIPLFDDHPVRGRKAARLQTSLGQQKQ